VFALLDLDNGGQESTDLDNWLSTRPISQRKARTVTNGCSRVIPNDEDASVKCCPRIARDDLMQLKVDSGHAPKKSMYELCGVIVALDGM
jgi:hypothetical protein